jgi:hypothetical protein
MDACHCPHCHLALEGWDRRVAGRCPNCRLVVGPGRAIDAPPTGAPGRAVSAAALLGLRAHREDGKVLDREVVVEGLREAARIAACPLSELRMVDYAQLEQDGAGVVPLADLLATFGGWKPARSAAMAAARVEREAGLDPRARAGSWAT